LGRQSTAPSPSGKVCTHSEAFQAPIQLVDVGLVIDNRSIEKPYWLRALRERDTSVPGNSSTDTGASAN
jgi:hypothetical protein